MSVVIKCAATIFWESLNKNINGNVTDDDMLIALKKQFPDFESEEKDDKKIVLKNIVEHVIDENLDETITKKEWKKCMDRFGPFESFLDCIKENLFVDGKIENWFHGKISGTAGAALFKGIAMEGFYLVRYGTKQAFTMSYTANSKGRIKVYSMAIFRVKGGFAKKNDGVGSILFEIIKNNKHMIHPTHRFYQKRYKKEVYC